MPAYTWHKAMCNLCKRKERYRGRAALGSEAHRCLGCHVGSVRVREIHWGPEQYAQGRNGQVDRIAGK